eukprot:Plantae.Rhodophyta-Purpureofilum_apyrenoidigerum.ctg5101.p1 GENE.Plantae.Rhodophyta-Purpureofilum_apyrenoidigerum.ctg5101~~Plantae.Rhodophyta-Purpureofilum_apyrenoidigerum.ctg5101.p1  ORF type:complete len:537 (-),score=74.95 Plantae.Rhodophyta-Purpureofilum_apyrenoidigerum.ctg5101:47-1489(-)
MDVVYNHTSEDANEFNLLARFSFNGLAPRYYYRNCISHPVAATGHNTCAWHGIDEPHCGTCYSNGSGCGNEFRSDAPMGRKFLLDSLRYWVKEYKVDGFRFDLMGLIDQETLSHAAKMLKSIDSRILIYGEPWTGGPSPIIATVKGFQRSRQFGVFNDSMRDALRGGNWGISETFLMDGGEIDKVKKGIMGSVHDFADQPTEVINYVECHDNRTLWDQFDHFRTERTDNIKFTDSDLERMHKLAAVTILTAQGIPFIQIGQEMCRTKGGVENSYESSDETNMIHWQWKRDRARCVSYYKGLIRMRLQQKHLFALKSAENIEKQLIFYEELGLQVPPRCIAFRIRAPEFELDASTREVKQSSEYWSEVVVLLNPMPVESTFPLPCFEGDLMWLPVVSDLVAGTEPIGSPAISNVAVKGRSAMVLRRCTDQETLKFSAFLRLSCITAPFESTLTGPFSLADLGIDEERIGVRQSISLQDRVF